MTTTTVTPRLSFGAVKSVALVQAPAFATAIVVYGALQKRHELVPGKEPIGYECTIGISDIDRTMAEVTKHGGKVILPKCEIPTVGYLFKFLDPEGNVVCAKQAYDAKA